ncbi:MAG: AAA family ATPase [Desulfobacterales bacterium]|nr:AAA family ATPase [Desulfobacterales bacterium]
MNWNFSRIDPRCTADEIADRMNETLNSVIEEFLVYYKEYLPAAIPIKPQAINTLGNILKIIAKTSCKLYLLIDEYDNFANEVMASDEHAYRRLLQKEGPVKTLYKGLKELTETSALDRLFITGVSPVVMSDITSGANIFTNIYLDAGFNSLCEFTGQEVCRMADAAVHTCKLEPSSADTVMQMMETWYNGFLFSQDTKERMYNPTLVFYFLDHFNRSCTYPRQMPVLKHDFLLNSHVESEIAIF